MSRGKVNYDPILCDLDGTLVDSAHSIIQAVRSACRVNGVSLGEAELSSFVGPPLEESFKTLVNDPDVVRRLMITYRHEYARTARSTPLMQGARLSLERWHEEGIALGVVTYKPTEIAESILVGTGIRRLIRLLVGRQLGDDPRRKEDLLREALNRLRPHRGEPLYIGDHREDEVAAASCGIDFAGFGPGGWEEIARDIAVGPSRSGQG